MKHLRIRQCCPECKKVIPFCRIATALWRIRCPHCGVSLGRRRISLLQGFGYLLIAMPFVVLAVLVQTPFGEIHLPIVERVLCFMAGALASELYLDLTSPLELNTKGNYAI